MLVRIGCAKAAGDEGWRIGITAMVRKARIGHPARA
jgi:hypothetical protein